MISQSDCKFECQQTQDSDDEDDGEPSRTASPAARKAGSASPDVKKRSPSPEQFKTEEEKQLEFVSGEILISGCTICDCLNGWRSCLLRF